MGLEQTTLQRPVTITGAGVHSGETVEMTLFPAPAGAGIKFRRTTESGARTIPAHVDLVGPTELCTVLGDPERGSVATVEHLMAALRGLGIDNAVIAIDGGEVPIMDGCAETFVAALDEAGIAVLSAPRRRLKVLKTVRVEQGDGWAELSPHGRGFRLEVEIDFPVAVIGRQTLALELTPRSFRRDLMRARTFGFLKDVEKLVALGYARGASLENTVALDGERVLNPEGLRAPDEFVRHKTLDAVGDLALVGLPIQGCFRSFRGGHRLNVAVARTLLADSTAWTIVSDGEARRVGHGEPMPALQPAFAGDAG